MTPDYFDLMGIRLADGRLFRPTDAGDAPRVAVINQTMAARYFPSGNALGGQIRFAGDPKRALEIVGIVTDTRTEALDARADPEIHLSFWQSGAFSKHLVVRAAGDPRLLFDVVRREVRSVDPTAAVEHFTTMAQLRRQSFAPRTFAMHLLLGFSALATVLSLVGVYGVLSLSVGSRLKEIAVRKAIGAQHRDILRLVLAEGSRLIAAGVIAGAGVAVLLGRLLETHLFEVQPADPWSLGAAALGFGALALAICLVPARRAAQTDLLTALHQE